MAPNDIVSFLKIKLYYIVPAGSSIFNKIDLFNDFLSFA
jgi:hypothetical protein